MKNYYEENYKAFIERNPLYQYIDKEECQECNLVVDTDQKGNKILGVVKDEYVWCLGSTYDNEYFHEVWLNSIKLENYQAVVYLFGLGDVELIRRLNKRYPDNRIIIYEPNLGYLKCLMENFDLRDIISNHKIVLLAGKEGMVRLTGLNLKVFEVTNYRYSVYRENVQYASMYPEECKKWNENLYSGLNNVILDMNTVMQYGKGNLKNVINNQYDCIKACNIVELIEVLKPIMNDTAVLVSAGPSLDKNIELLSEVKGKAFIIAVDTAIRPMLKRGIKPDMTIVVDAHKPLELFTFNDEVVDIPIITSISANSEVLEVYRGRKIFSYDLERCFCEIYNKPNFMNVVLNTAGSVANNACSFLMKAGFKNIILIGQDLAYPNGKIHAESTFKDRARIDLVKEDYHFEVEDIYGNKVLTEYNMNQYRLWFERTIKEYPNFNIVDATEGGAKIDGTRIMTFREAIDEYVKGLPEINYENVIRVMPEVDDKERERRLSVFYGFPVKMKETRNDIEDALKAYEELERLNEKKEYSSRRFKNVTKRIDDLSNKIKESIYALLIARVKEKEDYDILGEIYVNKESVYDEIKLVVESGKKLLTRYLESYEMIENMVIEAVEYAKVQEKIRKAD